MSLKLLKIPKFNLFLVNSCVAFWQFFATRLFFADSFSHDHRTKKLSPRTHPEILIRNFWLNTHFQKWIFTVSLTGSGPEIIILDQMGDSFGFWRSRLSFRFHGTVYLFPVQGTLAKNCQSAMQLLGGKKDDATVKIWCSTHQQILWQWSCIDSI